MDWLELLQKIFDVCIIPLLGVLTAYAVQWIKLRSSQIQKTMDNEMLKKYTSMLEATISNCVIATNQTYVEALKEQNAFGSVEQKIAFEKTYVAVMEILTEEAKNYLQEMFGDLQAYITSQIEAQVNKLK